MRTQDWRIANANAAFLRRTFNPSEGFSPDRLEFRLIYLGNGVAPMRQTTYAEGKQIKIAPI